MTTTPRLFLGAARGLDARASSAHLHVPAHHLVTHGVVVGLTGSGKTGLVTVMVEEALRSVIPVLAFDVKGDLPNLLLAIPSFAAEHVRPWASAMTDPTDLRTEADIAAAIAAERQRGLEAWGLGERELASFHRTTNVRIITPGSTAGEPLHVLSSLERRSGRWDDDPEAARASLSAAVSLVLRLVGRDCDPARSKEHVLLSVLAERRLRGGEPADLGSLLGDLTKPPVDSIGALPIDSFLAKTERRALAAALNNLLASPTFASWRTGATLDVAGWLTPGPDGRTPAAIVSVAHLDDEERALVLGVILEEVLTWVRSQPGTQRLRALVVFDEVYGFLPPHPANPPTKRPLVALMKQARAFGVGVLVATQNPMDLDYRALGNAGIWCVGRLQTDADCVRVVDGMASSDAASRDSAKALAAVVKRLAPRWFVMRDAHAGAAPFLLQPRWAMSLLRGPMTRVELDAARRLAASGEPPPWSRRKPSLGVTDVPS
jgi:hypothetical protein